MKSCIAAIAAANTEKSHRSMNKPSETTALVWFRNSLRATDFKALYTACKEAQLVIPFYCFDDHFHTPLYTGWPKTGAFRTRFLLESLEELRLSLQKLGSDLYITRGITAAEIMKIHQKFPISCIYLPTYPTPEELDIEKGVQALGIPMKRFFEHTLIHPSDLPFPPEKVPHVFTDFRKKTEKSLRIQEPLPSPESVKTPEEFLNLACPTPRMEDFGFSPLSDDPRSAFKLKGGEIQATHRIDHYFFKTHSILRYKETRNGLIGQDYSSKLSAYLAAGCVSPRTVFKQLKTYENHNGANESTYWLFFELLWRDFFHFTALKSGHRFFKIGKEDRPKVTPKFEEWRLGQTCEPFVNANMKELLHTGFMSNRGRQNVASFLVHHLKQDWYLGAMWFESQLIDYDPCSNYGNWTYLAGVGNDPRNRVFNIKKQADIYDPHGAYQSLWNA
jgi:deoxyribodipyrimidine photo-lyase